MKRKYILISLAILLSLIITIVLIVVFFKKSITKIIDTVSTIKPYVIKNIQFIKTPNGFTGQIIPQVLQDSDTFIKINDFYITTVNPLKTNPTGTFIIQTSSSTKNEIFNLIPYTQLPGNVYTFSSPFPINIPFQILSSEIMPIININFDLSSSLSSLNRDFELTLVNIDLVIAPKVI